MISKLASLVVFLVFWLIGSFAALDLARIGWLPTHWAMVFGVAWAIVCDALRAASLEFMEDWRNGG